MERPVERWATHGQEQLLDVRPDMAQVPVSDVKAIAAWLADVLAGHRTEISLPRRDEIAVGAGYGGTIFERLMCISSREGSSGS